jgi:hypothetical protein
VTVYEVAEDFLSLAASLLADPPVRQFVTTGEIAVFPRCEQLASTILEPATSRGLGSPSPSPVVVCLAVPIWRVCVELWRCVPIPGNDGKPPPAGDLSASAASVSADWEDLFFGFLTPALDGSLLPEGCSLASLEAAPVGPTAGMVGFRLCVRFELSRVAGAGS